MDQRERFCAELGHQHFQVNRICTYEYCHLSRWCCSECKIDGIHEHQLPNQNHLMGQEQLSAKVRQDIEKLKKDYLQSQKATKIKNFFSQLLKESEQLEQIITEIRQKFQRTTFKKELFKKFLELEWLIIEFITDVQRQQSNLISDTDNLKLNSMIEKVEGQSLVQLEVDDINKLLNISQFQFKHNVKQQFKVPLNKIQQQLNMLKNDYFIKEYVINKIYEGDDKCCIDSSILSNNEKFLLYNKSQVIHIYDIKLNKICKTINNKSTLTTLQFTSDSKYLFAAGSKGVIFGFLVQDNFKKFYYQKIHGNKITQIITYKQYLITSSCDKTIIKTDFLNKQQICKLIGYSSTIYSIDYFHQRNIIISSSYDKTIKIWSCFYSRILIDYPSRMIKQISLINNQQYILGLDNYGSLWKWEIDLTNNKLVSVDNKIFSKDRIYRFQTINNDQNLLLICKNDCLIFNHQNVLMKKIVHNLKLESGFYTMNIIYTKQSDNLNYIILHQGIQFNIISFQNPSSKS